MGKSLYIAEKPSVAQEFAKALKQPMTRYDGYLESGDAVVTWCVGHLVSMSYPEAYGEQYKRWSLATLPFLPDHFLYEVIPSSKKQFGIVRSLLNRKDVSCIYVCTDSGREGEYIYRLVAQEAGVKDKEQRRVWIDSQTEEEILRGIREAKDLSAYDNLAAAAYLRAQEDYLMGINFSRVLTLKYGNAIAAYLHEDRCVVSVGRVMTCVLGMVVRREREIRAFQETPFYRVIAQTRIGADADTIDAEWRVCEGSPLFGSPKLYRENGFLKKEDAQALIDRLSDPLPAQGTVTALEKKTEKKNPPLLYNLAELQNECSRMFKISPDETLRIAQELYEKKLVTYPRTDARVLSSAIAKEIDRNIRGLTNFAPAAPFAQQALESATWKGIAKTRYVNDRQITDHYALIPTGQGLSALRSLSRTSYGVYCVIVRRFLGIFFPPAQYRKISLTLSVSGEMFCAGVRMLREEGYLAVMKPEKKSASSAEDASAPESGEGSPSSAERSGGGSESGSDGTQTMDATEDNRRLLESLEKLRRGSVLDIPAFRIREGKTSPPRRYNSGSMILAMENAGQLIEDEELRAQIRGSGIGTSATRAEILKKLVTNRFLALNSRTQVLTPTQTGEMIYDVVDHSIRSLLNPELTASWEKGLTYVAEGTITPEEYMEKLRGFVARRTNGVRDLQNQTDLRACFDRSAVYYRGEKKTASRPASSQRKSAARSAGSQRTASRSAVSQKSAARPAASQRTAARPAVSQRTAARPAVSQNQERYGKKHGTEDGNLPGGESV